VSAEATTASTTDVATTAEETTKAVSTPNVTGQTTQQIFTCNRLKAMVSRNGVFICGQTEIQSLNFIMAAAAILNLLLV